jgi:hypothetical protein
VHAWRELFIGPVTLPSLDWDAVEQEEQAELAERLAGWQEKYPDVHVQRFVVRDVLLGQCTSPLIYALLASGGRVRTG